MPGSGKTLSQPENGWLAVIRLARSPVEDAVAGVDQRMADAATDVALASAGRTEDQNRGAAVEPGVATGQGHDVGLGEHGHLGELEAGERLGRIELRLDAVPFDAPLGSLSHLVLEEAAQEARSRPAFLVGALGELGPEPADRRHAQLAQHQGVATRIDGARRVHAVTSNSSSCSLGSSAS